VEKLQVRGAAEVFVPRIEDAKDAKRKNLAALRLSAFA